MDAGSCGQRVHNGTGCRQWLYDVDIDATIAISSMMSMSPLWCAIADVATLYATTNGAVPAGALHITITSVVPVMGGGASCHNIRHVNVR